MAGKDIVKKRKYGIYVPAKAFSLPVIMIAPMLLSLS